MKKSPQQDRETMRECRVLAQDLKEKRKTFGTTNNNKLSTEILILNIEILTSHCK